MLIPSGFANVTWEAQIVSGFRSQATSCAFAVAGFNSATGPNALNAAFSTFLDSIGWHTGSTVGPVTVKVGTADPQAPLTYVSGTSAGVGTVQVIAPPQVSILATKFTLLGGRKGRGRMFLPQPQEDRVSETGALESTYQAAVQTALDTLISTAESILGGQAYLLHSDATAPTQITDILVQNKVATQRRRLGR